MAEAMEEIKEARPRRFRPYPEYRASKVEWLGEIPRHWNVTRTKFAARLESGHTPSRQNADFWDNCTIPWFGLADVWQIRDGRKEYVVDTNENVSERGLAHSSARLLPKGTVILSRTASVGFSAIMGTDMATTQDFVNWVCGPRLRPEYLLYVFRSMGQEFRRLTMGSTHQTIYMPDVSRFETPIPPLDEQDRIVAFIRQETVKIDRLAAKKKRLVELLREKRTALITRTVTQGLDLNAPMQDSRIQWLGEVPASWSLKRLKYLIEAPLAYGVLKPDRYEGNDGVPLIRILDVEKGEVREEQLLIISPQQSTEYRRTVVNAGDLILSVVGTIGQCFVVPKSLEGANLSRALARIQLGPAMDKDFLEYSLASTAFRTFVELIPAGTAQKVLNLGDLARFVVPTPGVSEQKKITGWLGQEVARVDSLARRILDGIDRLREFRTALILAAVTGKIDVRKAST